MKVLFISPSFYPATYYGGPTFINRSLCDTLSKDESVELEVLTTDANGPNHRVNLAESEQAVYPITYCRRIFLPDIAPGLLWRLFGMIKRADVVHLNAVYSFTTIPTLAICKLMRKPVVWSLHGALQPWPGSRRENLKSTWIRLCNLLCQPARVVIHSATPEEAGESLPALSRGKSVVVPYGVDLPKLVNDATKSGTTLRLLYLGRLHPIKGIENLLRALSLAKNKPTLEICGTGDKVYQERLHDLVNELGISEQVRFHRYISGEAKADFFRRADICVVPSFKESFGSVVTEALAHRVPVIAGRGTPWPRLEDVGCGLWVENSPEEIAAAIDRSALMPLREMGQRGREWMDRDFKWSEVAAVMIAQYRMLVQREVRDGANMATCPEAPTPARHA